MVDGWLATGLLIGDQRLEIEQYGGVVGLDGLHFTDTAYAILANAFIDEINGVFSSNAPHIDVAQVWSEDRERPEALRQDGLEPEACRPPDP